MAEQLTLATRDVHAPLAVAVVDIATIAPGRDNPRRDLQDIDAFEGSIGQYGQLQNLNVFAYEEPDEDGRLYELIAGSRRYESIAALRQRGSGTGKVLVAIHPPGTDLAAIATIENEHRRPLRAGERIAAIKKCRSQTRMTLRGIAAIYDTSVATVKSDLRIADALPAIALEKLDTRQLSKEAALQLVPLAQKAPAIVASVISDVGERVTSAAIVANPDLVVYEAVRDGRVQLASAEGRIDETTFAEPFSGGLDLLAVDEVMMRARAALVAAGEWLGSREQEARADKLLRQLQDLDSDERLAHVEPSDVHHAMQTAPEGAIVSLDTGGDDATDVLSRAVICTSPRLMLEWALRAAEQLVNRNAARPATDAPESPTIVGLEHEAILEIKRLAREWNTTLGMFCDDIRRGTAGCDTGEQLERILLGFCHTGARLTVGQGVGHVRRDWRIEETTGVGGLVEERYRAPLGAEEAQRRFDAEVAHLPVIEAKRVTIASIVAGALCDTREVGARERLRRLQLPAYDTTLTGGIGAAIHALAKAWDNAPESFADDVRERLGVPAHGHAPLTEQEPGRLKRRSRKH